MPTSPPWVQAWASHWQAALGAVFISGCPFILISLFPHPRMIVNATALRSLIDLGWHRPVPGHHRPQERRQASSPATSATLVTLGNLHAGSDLRRHRLLSSSPRWPTARCQAIINGILVVTVAGILTGQSTGGVFAAPPADAPP